ncbi:MAG TPA: hypothetical protein VF186_09735 [Gaiellaceae bacterium]
MPPRRRRLLGAAVVAPAIVAIVVGFVVAQGSAAAPTFESVTEYLTQQRPHPPGATAVSSADGFVRAVARARAGQTIVVAPGVKIPGEFKGFNRVVRGGTVNVVFKGDSGFTGDAGSQLPAVWLRRSGGWRIWGGTITNPDGFGILVNAMPGPVVWTGFTVKDTGDSCVAVYPADGDIDRLTLKGVAGTADPNLAWDPHAEKGTGQHAWNIADADGGLVENSTFATDTVDQATGAAVSIDTGQIGPNVTVYARAYHVGFAIPGTSWTGDARYQVAGNVVQLWGASLPGSLDIAYVEGDDIQGRLLDTTGVDPGANLSGVHVDLGRATGPILQNPLLSRIAYDTAGGIVLGNVTPRP